MTVFLLLAAVVILACVMLDRVSDRLGIPVLLAFILLGMFFGSDGVVRIPFDDFAFAERICSIALIFIMFYGGFGTSWRAARPVAAQSLLLSTVGVAATAGLTGLFCHYVLGMDWLEGMLVGSVISSTDAASVFSVLRSRRLSLRDNTASLLEVESGSNDPCSYMLTAVFISAMQGGADALAMAKLLFSQLVFGALCGFAIAFAARWLIRHLHTDTAGYDVILVLGVALLSYAAPAALGGNGFLSAYIVGLVLGNSGIPNKRNLVHFFDGVTGLMQILIFFLLGLLSFPSRLPSVALPALAIALFLTFAARPLAVALILRPFGSSLRQRLLVSWSGLRGAASIVFAIMALTSVETENDIFHITFFIVLFSILLQGSLIPLFARRLHMIDAEADVMKTFSDYSDEVPVQFIRLTIPQSHPWCGMTLREIVLPPDTLAVLLRRGGESIAPSGGTVLEADDTLILSAVSPGEMDGVSLTELPIGARHRYVGKSLAELPKDEISLVILIKRGGGVVIPGGSVVLAAGDVLVMNRVGQQ